VRLWNATTAECILCFDFGKPIASLAFHSEGDVLAVASGHKLYTWNYTKAMAPCASAVHLGNASQGQGQGPEESGGAAGATAAGGGWMGMGGGVAGSFPRGSERGRRSVDSSGGG
jgi:hypothetical protein